MSRHTQGPWAIGNVSHKKQRVDIDSPHADPTVGHQTWRGLARAYGCNDMPAEGSAAMLANARLIAAAPELLEALSDCVAHMHWTQPLGEAALKKAKAAIAKATGGDA